MNVKEQIDILGEDVKTLQVSVESLQKSNNYIVSLLEDLTSTITPKVDNTDALKNVLGTLKDTIMKDKHVGQRPEVQDLLSKMFDSVTPGGV